MTGFRRARKRRSSAKSTGEATPPTVIGTFAPIEVALLRQFVSELMLLLEAEAGARPVDPAPLDRSDESPPAAGPRTLEPAESGETAPGDATTLSDADVDDVFAALTSFADPVPDPQAPVRTPEDPVVARLLPDAYTDDGDSALEFRRFTQDRLVTGKHASAAAVLASLPTGDLDDLVELPLTQDQAQQWLRTLNDVRLAIGTRLDVQQDDEPYWDALPDDDPRGTVHEIYQWLGWVQETLVGALRG